MKYDPRIITSINETFSVIDILSRERGDQIPAYDTNVSCVAHSDKHPSMRIYHGEGRHAFCFSCGKTYTPYSILKHLLNENFFGIVEHLQNYYGYTIPESLEGESFNDKLNIETATRITYLKKYMNPKLLDLVQKAVYADSREGQPNMISSLYEKVISIKEPDCI